MTDSEPSLRDEAITLHREVIAEAERLTSEYPASPDYGHLLATSHNNFGTLLQKLARHAEAVEEFRRSIRVSAKLVADFPGSPNFAVMLAGSDGNLGHYFREMGRPEDAIAPLNDGVKLLSEILKKSPGDETARRFLRNDYSYRAYAFDDLRRHAEAARDWHSALELSDPPMAPKYRLGEAVSRARGDGQHERALKLASELATESGIEGEALYGMACICSTASKGPPPSEPYAAQAVALLRLAVARRFADDVLIRGDADFTPLRQRPDFQALLAEAERNSKASRPNSGKAQK